MRNALCPTGRAVKICGLTRAEDVALASELGAWAVGFIFAPSPRRLTPAAARALVESLGGSGTAVPGPLPASPGWAGATRPLAIGVFDALPAEEIARVVEEVGLDGVQLHSPVGPGGAAVRAALAGRAGALLVIQVVPVASNGARDACQEPRDSVATGLRDKVAQARKQADVVLLDTRASTGLGGSGTTFLWDLVTEAGDGGPLLIAGGISPTNVGVALWQSGASGVDVSSGVERSPGVKDHRLVRQLFECVRAAEDHTWVWPRAGGPPGAGASR